MMNTPMARKNTLKNREYPSTASRPPYRIASFPGSITRERTASPIRPSTESQPSSSFRSSGRNRSTMKTRKASPARANSGVSK